jgi:transglutaminase-like putative cysteine protease
MTRFSQTYAQSLPTFLLFVCLLTAGASSQQPSPTSSSSAPPAKSSSTPAQSPKAGTTPAASAAEKAADSVKAEAKAPDYAQESFVIEQMHSHYRFEADGTGRKETTARIRVQSEAGVQQWGQLQEGYNSANERVEIPYVRVLKEDGTVVKAGDDAVQDLSAPIEREAPVYTDYRQKHITVPGLRPGEVLEYDMVTVIHTPLAAGQFWTEYEFDKANIDSRRDPRRRRPRRPLPEAEMQAGDGSQDHRSQRPPHLPLVEFASRARRRCTKAKDKDKKKKKHRPDDDRPDIQLTTFETWEQIGRWYAGLEKDRRAPTPEVRAKAQELTKGLNTDLEKTEALYDFVAKNFRYVSLSLGVGRYQPHAAPTCCTTSMATAKTSTPCWRRCSRPKVCTPTPCSSIPAASSIPTFLHPRSSTTSSPCCPRQGRRARG